jgi:hypothetical protein
MCYSIYMQPTRERDGAEIDHTAANRTHVLMQMAHIFKVMRELTPAQIAAAGGAGTAVAGVIAAVIMFQTNP